MSSEAQRLVEKATMCLAWSKTLVTELEALRDELKKILGSSSAVDRLTLNQDDGSSNLSSPAKEIEDEL